MVVTVKNRIPESWLKEIAAGTPFGKRAERLLGNSPVQQQETKSAILIAIEFASGTKVTCSQCRTYLNSIVSISEVEKEAIARKLSAELPLPLNIREQCSNQQKRYEWIMEIVESVANLPKATQFVYLNIIGPDNGEELRLSMASVRKNFTGTTTFTVIGDKPTWYTEHHIPVSRLTKMRELPGRMAFRDTQAKIMLAASHPEIEEEFVWMMDDQFFLKPTSLEDLRVFRYDPWYRTNSKREWHRLIKLTFGALAANGRSNFQAGTHLPHVFEKTKLQQMFVEYGFPNNLYLFEILYENHWQCGRPPIPYGSTWQGVQYPQFLRRLLRSLTLRQLNEIDSNVLNYQSNVWRPVMRDWLRSRFTEE